MTRYLDAHPQVHMAPGKELRFFTTNYDKGVGWYSDQFAGAEARLCGEATPAYLANPTAMNRLRELLPDVRLIAILRDPVDRALSHYWMARERGRESREFPHAAYDEMGQLRMDVARSAILPYLGPGLYAHHLGRVLDLFPRTRVLPLIFERMVDDPISGYRELCTFLEIDPEYVPDNLGRVVNPYVTFRSLALREKARKLPRLPRRAVQRFNTSFAARYPPMPIETRRELNQFFLEPNRSLERLLGFRIDEWGR